MYSLRSLLRSGSGSAVLRSARALEANAAVSMIRFAWLFGVRKFSQREIFRLALLDPELSWADLRRYRTKEEAWPIYESYNAPDGLLVLNDKARFHDACRMHSLPALSCAGILTREQVQSLSDRIAAGDTQPMTSLLGRLPPRFVAKPSLGYGGRGVHFFTTDGRVVRSWSGEPLSAAAFSQQLCGSFVAPTVQPAMKAADAVLIFQPVVLAHPAIRTLTGHEIVQSLRICTIVDDKGVCRIHFAFFKVVAGSNLIDNFQEGSSGNLIAFIDEPGGRIFRAIGAGPSPGVGAPRSHHPDTGASLIGFQIPCWAEACRLAMRAASCFPRTRAVGWDIGITPDGPLLIEGNGTWNPNSPVYRPFPLLHARRRGAAGAPTSPGRLAKPR